MLLKNMNFKGRSILYTWVISYVVVLFVPVIIGSVIYKESIKSIENETNRANESILMQVQQAVDSKLKDIERLCTDIALNKTVSNFVNVKGPVVGVERSTIFDIGRDIKSYHTTNEFLKDFYIFFRNSDTVISSNGTLDGRMIYEMIRKDEQMSYEEWRDYFLNRYLSNFIPVIAKTDSDKFNDTVAYVRSVSVGSLGQPDAVILLLINKEMLLKTVQGLPIARENTLIIKDKMDVTIASTKEQNPTLELKFEKMTGSKGLLYEKADKENLVVSYIASQVTDWKYATITHSDLFWEKSEYIRNLTILSFVLSLLIGGLVTFYFLKRNYYPVDNMLQLLANKAGLSFDTRKNEFKFIQDAICNALDENEKINEKLKQQNNVFRSNFLTRLVKGKLEGDVPVNESLSKYKIAFDTEYFGVILLYIDDFSQMFKDEKNMDSTERIKLVNFVIANVVEELAGQCNLGYITEVDDMLVCLFNLKEQRISHGLEDMSKVAAEAQSFLSEKFHIYLTISISDIHSTIAGIPQAYSEALDALEYKLILGSGQIIRFDQIKPEIKEPGHSEYYYPMHVEQQLVNFIKTGDIENSKAVLEEVLSKNFASSSISIPIAKCLMFNLVSTMIKTMDEINSIYKNDVFKERRFTEHLMNCETVNEMKNEILNTLHQVCEYINSKRKEQGNEFYSGVIKYIEDNYSDPNLSVLAIGEHFKMTPSYLSRLFKEKTGQSLLDYIHRTRIDKARKLLKESSSTISEIGNQIGYNDDNTFTRVFKKYEGITPGKYKDIG